MSFRYIKPGVLGNDEGSIKLVGRAGMEIVWRGNQFDLDSELLATDGVVVYTSGLPMAQADQPPFRSFLEQAMTSIGWTVEFIPPTIS